MIADIETYDVLFLIAMVVFAIGAVLHAIATPRSITGILLFAGLFAVTWALLDIYP